MPTNVRPLETDAEFEAYLRAASYAFHTVRDDALLERYRAAYKPEWCLGAFENGMLVAGLTIIPFRQHMLGAQLPFGGIATVASLPEHRRGGHVGALLRTSLSRMHQAGQFVSGLYTPHFALYRKFGWEPSYRLLSYSLAPKVVKPSGARPGGTLTRLVADDWSSLDALREDALATANGPLYRDETRWRSSVFTGDHGRKHDAVLWSNVDGTPQGYLVYAQQDRPGRSANTETVLRVIDMVALSGGAYTALLHYLLSHDLAARIIITTGDDDPISAQVEEPALIQEPHSAYFGMALRLVDVPAALRARPPGPGSDGVTVTLRIRDATAPWNDGVWFCSSDSGKISVAASNATHDIEIDAACLGPLYNGFITTEAASRAGMLTAASSNAIKRLQLLLGVTRRPFCFDDF